MTNQEYYNYIEFCYDNLIPIPTKNDSLPVLPYKKQDIYTHIINYYQEQNKSISFHELQKLIKYVNREYVKSEQERLTEDKLQLNYHEYLKYKLQVKFHHFHTINTYDEMIVNYLIKCYQAFK